MTGEVPKKKKQESEDEKGKGKDAVDASKLNGEKKEGEGEELVFSCRSVL